MAAEVEWIDFQRCFTHSQAFSCPAHLSQNKSSGMTRGMAMMILDQRFIDRFQSSRDVSTHACDPRKLQITRMLPCIVPNGLIKCIISLIDPVLHYQSHSQIIKRLPVVWIRISFCQSLNGRSEKCFGFSDLSSAQVPKT